MYIKFVNEITEMTFEGASRDEIESHNTDYFHQYYDENDEAVITTYRFFARPVHFEDVNLKKTPNK